MITDPLFYAAAIPAVILTGLAKGGFAGLGLLAIPLMALVISPIQSAAILLPILMVQDVVTVYAYRHHADRHNLAVLLPAGLVGIGLGYLLAAQVSDAMLEIAIGTMSVGFSGRRLFGAAQDKPLPETRPSSGLGAFWGALGGFASMIANAGGPPIQIYLMPQRMDRDRFVGTSSFYFAVINWMKVPAFLALGQFTTRGFATSVALFPIAIASTYAGVLLVRRVSGDRFYRLVFGLLLLVGAKLLVDGVLALI